MIEKLKKLLFGEPRPVEVVKPAPAKKPNSMMLLAAKQTIALDGETRKAMIEKTHFERRLKLVQPKDADGITLAMDSAQTTKHGMDMKKFKSTHDSAYAMDNVSWGGMNDAQFTWYNNNSFIGYQACAILAQNWLIDKCCTIPAKDAVRKGYKLTRNDGEAIDPKVLDEIRALDRKFKVKRNMVEYIRFSRVFGIRICLFLVNNDDPKYYEKPFDIESVKPGTYRGMVQIDPYWLAPELSFEDAADVVNQHFYDPTFWVMSGLRVHRSHLAMIIPDEVADVLKPTYFYGGIPLTQKIWQRVYAAEQCANEAPQLLLTKRATTINIDLTAAAADPEKFNSMMQGFVNTRNNFGVNAIGLDDTMQQLDTSLTDVDQVIKGQYELVACEADVPITRLMGTSPSGLNATGDYESETYREMLETIQEEQLDPLLQKHYACLLKSELSDLGDIELIPVWEPLDSPGEKEVAEIQEIKSRTGQNLVNSGAINPAMEHARIMADPDSGYGALDEDEDLYEPPEEAPGTEPKQGEEEPTTQPEE